MSEKQSKLEEFQEVDPECLLNYQQGTAIEISFKEQDDDHSLDYPSMLSKKSSEANSWKKNRGSQGELEEVVGIKKSSYALEDSFNSDSYSFSFLNSSVNEEDLLKSKLVCKLKELRQEDHVPTQKQLKMFNQSIFTEKTQIPRATVKKQSESSEGSVQNMINYGKSFYMTRQQPVAKPQKNKKQAQRKQKMLNVSFSSKNYFLQIKQSSVEIDRTSLEDLYNQLFRKQIFVPLFNYERFDEWANIKEFSKYTTECEAHMNFKVYLERYIAYLNQYCLQSLEGVIQNVQLIQQGKNEKKNNQQSTYSLFNFDFYNILDNLKSYINSNKYQILRKTLLAKIKSIKAMMKENQRWKMTPDEAELLAKTIATTWKQLAEIQLLLSFESTEELCLKKIQSSPQLKFKQIWLKYRDINRQQKAKLLSGLEDIGL